MTAAAFAAAVALSLLAYALLGRRRDPDAERRQSRFLMGAGDFLVHWFLWLVSPLERGALALGWPPIAFNFIGLAAGALAGLLLARGRLAAGAWALLACGILDILDGRVARARGAVSARGAFLDSSLDRFVEAFAFLGLVFYFRERPAGAFAAALAMAGSLLVSYTRARGESLGVSCREGLMQRAERLALMWLAGVLDGWTAAWWGRAPGTLMLWTTGFIGAATFVTSVHRTWWIAARLKPPT